MKIIYTGIFFDTNDLEKAVSGINRKKLEKVIANPHVTNRFKPIHEEEKNDSYLGKEVTVKIVGYACDGKNEGVKVEIMSDDPFFAKTEAAVPHITLSVSADGKPVNTWALNFEPVEPTCLTGKYGYYLRGGRIMM